MATREKQGNNEKIKIKTHININTHLEMKLRIVILEKCSNPTLKEKETPINYILIVSIPEEAWRIITVTRNGRANISHKQNLLFYPTLYLQHPIFKLHFLPFLSPPLLRDMGGMKSICRLHHNQQLPYLGRPRS